jgi:hypothetical protein
MTIQEVSSNLGSVDQQDYLVEYVHTSDSHSVANNLSQVLLQYMASTKAILRRGLTLIHGCSGYGISSLHGFPRHEF